ncbi:MAG: dihydroxyacetone kinase subunit DhaL [Terracidiphilus sp.]
MKDRIAKAELGRMFAEAAKLICGQSEFLSQLDSQCGDGDHGTTMTRAMEILVDAIGPANELGMSEMFKQAGWSVMGVDGGASGALLGTFISGMGDAQAGGEFDCSALAASLEAGLGAVSSRTKARPGDKTMMDALVPAVETFRTAAESGKSAAVAMDEAAAAAQAGADSTRNLVARYGRAKYLGEKTLGCADAGATSIALLFRGFSVALATEKEN